MRSERRRVLRIFPFLISVTFLGGCGGDGGAGPGPPPTSISIAPPTQPIPIAATWQFQATGSFSGGATRDVTNDVTWTSSNMAAVTISDAAGSKGLATRAGGAPATITATLGSVVGSQGVPAITCTLLASGLTFQAASGGTVGTGFALGMVVADASAVYWFEYNGSLGNTGGSLKTVPKNGGAVVILASGLGGVNAIAVDDTHLYWTEFAIVGGAGSVKRVPKGGGTVQVLATGTPAGSMFDVFFPAGLALDAAFAYWGESVGGLPQPGAIRRVPKVGGAVVDFGRGQGVRPMSRSLALDPSFIYGVGNPAASGPASSAGRLPITGGTVEVFASGLDNAGSAALDASSLYWVELTDRTAGSPRLQRPGVRSPSWTRT